MYKCTYAQIYIKKKYLTVRHSLLAQNSHKCREQKNERKEKRTIRG